MQFIRNNLFYVVLLALTVLFAVGELVYYFVGDIDTHVEKRTKLSAELETVRKNLDSRQVNDEKLKALAARGLAVKEAAKADEEATLQFNRRNFKVLEIPFGGAPEPAFPIDSAKYVKWNGRWEFSTKYIETIEGLLKQPRLRGIEPPTTKDVEAAVTAMTTPGSKPEVVKKLARQKVILDWTQKGALYLGDKILDRIFTEPVNAATDEKLWEAQVNIWVTEEILRAIITANEELAVERDKALGGGAGEGGVTDSAVRHLLSINIDENFAMPKGSVATGSSGEAPTLTRRYSTGRYGVLNYDFTVVMPSRHVERLLRALMLQNYHAIHRVNLTRLLPDDSLVYYGPEEVMKVEVAGELLLLRSWINPLMPKPVAERLPPK